MINESWALLCELGFWGWNLSFAGFLLSAFPWRGTFRAGMAALYGAVFIACFAAWIFGMLSA